MSEGGIKTKPSNETTHVEAANPKSDTTRCSVLTRSVLHFGKTECHVSKFYGKVRVRKNTRKRYDRQQAVSTICAPCTMPLLLHQSIGNSLLPVHLQALDPKYGKLFVI